MTKNEYEDFALRYKGCGACFPMYYTLSRFEKMWFTAIQKDVTELTEQNTSLLTSVENLNKTVQELEKENAELKSELSKVCGIKGCAKLTKAKDHIKKLIEAIHIWDCKNLEKVETEAENFLKESEVEK